MRAGGMDRRIEIQEMTIVADTTFGGISGTSPWSTVATVWAQVVPNKGRERENGGQIAGTFETIFRIRYRAGLTINNRIIYKGKTYDIFSIVEIGRNEGLELGASVRTDPE